MQYLGGKHRSGKHIANLMQPYITNRYIEPFCGMCGVAQHIQAPIRLLSDVHLPLITMWQALQQGWIPPENVSEELYKECQQGKHSLELQAFVGFGCSFAAKYFGGYARNTKGHNFAKQAKINTLSRLHNLKTAKFMHRDYRSAFIPLPGDVVYYDPPYTNTTQYRGTPKFDSEIFWAHANVLAKLPIFIFVSECKAPNNWESYTPISSSLGYTTNKDYLWIPKEQKQRMEHYETTQKTTN